MKEEGNANIPSYGLPTKILCKVVDVKLKADPDTDEAFAEITLLPAGEEVERSAIRADPQKVPASSFQKILTASDVNTHGGFSLPKRHVEETFPHLDLSQANRSQEISARDLHGTIWKFRHTYRVSGNRYKISTGWGTFVSAKKLVAGDTCVFLRGQNENELYIGVRRATRQHKPNTDLPCVSMQHGIIFTALDAIATRKEFNVFCYPWLSVPEFIVAYDDVMESLKVNYLPSMRVQMVFNQDAEELEHAPRQFSSGVIISKEDIDPRGWPQSEWRCLRVLWDFSKSRHLLPVRVSPWEIKFLDDNQLGGLQPRGIEENVDPPSSSHQDQTNSGQVKLFGVVIRGGNTGVHSQPGTSPHGN